MAFFVMVFYYLAYLIRFTLMLMLCLQPICNAANSSVNTRILRFDQGVNAIYAVSSKYGGLYGFSRGTFMCGCHKEFSAQEKDMMRRAIQLSKEKMESGFGGPFGAVVVKNGQVIAEGFNQVTSSNDPTAHAEIDAIRKACRKLENFDLSGCDIYTSCEPCPMCLSAIYWARLDKIYYANSREDAANIGFDDEMLYREIPKPIEQRMIPTERLLADEAIKPFEDWQRKEDKIAY